MPKKRASRVRDLGFWLPNEEYTALKAISVAHRKSVSFFVREAIAHILDQECRAWPPEYFKSTTAVL